MKVVFLLVVTALALVSARLTGGRLERLVRRAWRATPLAFLPLGIQAVIFSPWTSAWSPSLVMVLHLASYAGLLGFLALNWTRPGVAYLAAGTLANATVIAANGGAMPVSERALQGAGLHHVLAALQDGPAQNSVLLGPTSRLAVLGDVFWLPVWLPVANVFSAGDVLIAAGVFVLCHRAMKAA
ncbi:MAG: DUF5317 domain-containing protein [Bacillota bacterium]